MRKMHWLQCHELKNKVKKAIESGYAYLDLPHRRTVWMEHERRRENGKKYIYHLHLAYQVNHRIFY